MSLPAATESPSPREGSIPWQSLEAVLFDLDGTLVETNIDFPGMRQAILAAAARHGAAAEELEGLDALKIIATAGERVPVPDRFREETEAILQEIELAAGAGARAMPGAAALLETLAERRIAVGIVTRNCAPAAQLALERAGLPWGLLLTRADVPRVKPDPLHLLLAAERLGANPSRTLMVGDHPMDVVAGRAAGMWTAGLAPSPAAEARLAAERPHLLVRDLGELAAWISPPSS